MLVQMAWACKGAVRMPSAGEITSVRSCAFLLVLGRVSSIELGRLLKTCPAMGLGGSKSHKAKGALKFSE